MSTSLIAYLSDSSKVAVFCNMINNQLDRGQSNVRMTLPWCNTARREAFCFEWSKNSSYCAVRFWSTKFPSSLTLYFVIPVRSGFFGSK